MKKRNLMMMAALSAVLTCHAQAMGNGGSHFTFVGLLTLILGLAAVIGVLAIIWLLVIMLFRKVKNDKR